MTSVSQRQSHSSTGTIYVDADACPVKQEIFKVAERHGWTVQVVANDIIGIVPQPRAVPRLGPGSQRFKPDRQRRLNGRVRWPTASCR